MVLGSRRSRYLALGALWLLIFSQHLFTKELDTSSEPAETELDIAISVSGECDREIIDRTLESCREALRAGDAWSSRDLLSGDLPLAIVYDAGSGAMEELTFRFDNHRAYINSSAKRDSVIHETGHAIIHRIKPGWTSGASLIIHEALADMCTVLTHFRDIDAATRILADTSNELSRENEASRIVELSNGETLRSATTTLTLNDIPFDRTTLVLPAVILRGSRNDPHRASEVLTAALYEVFLQRLDHHHALGLPIVQSVELAANEVGRIMLSSLRYCGEHRVTLEQYAWAFLRSLEEYAIDSSEGSADVDSSAVTARSVDAARAIFRRRGVIDLPPEPTFPLRETPSFEIDEPFHTAEFTISLIAFETKVLDIAKKIPISEIGKRSDLPLLLHNLAYPFRTCGDGESLRVFETITDPDGNPGGFDVRVAYVYRSMDTRSAADSMREDPAMVPVPTPVRTDAYAYYSFDASGRFLFAHTDRPL